MLAERVLPPLEEPLRILDLGRRFELREQERLGVGVARGGESAVEDCEFDLGRRRTFRFAEGPFRRR